ncbi:signal peptidase I [Sphingorhabdus arenilitoris]|uniref:Signal peptidase I n=1 Tax=Sphingorhabdus arenilitoris TaxID=1490041 RepID=A0ABV8RFW3_9SPHN
MSSKDQAPQPEKDSVSEWKDYGKFLLKLALFMIILRSFIISPFNIPSESMQPRLLIGDYLIVSKWNYGYSKYSMVFGLPIIPGRIFASQPDRGDVVVFKAPPTQRDDYIKRVIGLPGDQIQMIDGVLYINGSAVKKERIADLVIPVTQNMKDAAALEGQTTACYKTDFEEAAPGGGLQCRYPRYRETLPEGRSYNILDIEYKSDADDTQVFIVKEGEVFLMGDNRDRSADSRFPAEEGGGIGLVPQENLIGKAMFSVFSTDGSSSWLLPWTWFTAARWDRVGEGF